MGYLMKEALKALCGVNQWSYAVFWKIGCQNPKLLIWEEFYYEAYPSSNTATGNTMENQGMALQKLQDYQNGTQVGDRVQFLVDKMMMSNQVNVVGEGLVGRAAFTGNYQWIVSGNHNEFSYPAEVLHEVNLQFSAGINTIAVIPVIPHGVVQFGSPLTISENTAFVHDVRSLITQLGCVPSAFVPDYIAKDDCISCLPAANATANPLVAGSSNLRRNSSDCVVNQSSNSLLTQFQDNLQVSGSSFMVNNPAQDSYKYQADNYASKTDLSAASSANPFKGFTGDRTGGTLTPLSHDSAMNQLINNPGSRISCLQASASCSRSDQMVNVNGPSTVISSMKNEREAGISGLQRQPIAAPTHANKLFHEAALKTVEQPINSSLLTNVPYYGNYNNNSVQDIDMHDVLQRISKNQEDLSFGSFTSEDLHDRRQALPSNNFISEDSFFQSAAGDDLFDVLGMDFKKNLLNPNDSKLTQAFDGSLGNKGLTKSMNSQNFGSGILRDFDGVSESCVFSSGSDHLLDAMISGVSSASRQTSDDSMSCRTTVSKISSSSVPSTPRSTSLHPPPSVGLFTMDDSMQRQLFGLSKSVGEPLGRSVGSLFGKNEGGICSTTNSTYGSQFSSWTEKGHTSSVSTANSKKADEGGKTNRKRLKPGENPRPRPKDRQMIQDRVKELREIVPNGAKCSIDSLLERTIKHMLFLQSITNHADKLKQTVESKVNRKEAGMLLKDNFEGGATWAFELGSQSMVCPIVVEDLNPPRQLLVEMLCEERGFFLEIADIIRGLGLTILKGVMEARNDKIWGRFAVEADRDVTRMEVFISLVHLLEQTLNSNTAPVNGGNENVVYPAAMAAKQPLVGPIVCGEPPAM
ncbi:hypothetical protein RND81_05G255500 [Saponaria officinalis]|uniref:BHLH domain-containing protein n=1 Tax=Saponaria officinalis TaxID=3572 RepID=A0AAW1L2C4_SAPOF